MIFPFKFNHNSYFICKESFQIKLRASFALFYLVYLLFVPFSSYGQKIIALETKWQDSYKEWGVYTEGDSINGNLELTWELDNDWTQWKFDIGDLMGSVKLRNRNQNFWEFRSEGKTITARPIWTNDLSEWRLTDGSHIIKLKTKYRDQPYVWYSVGEEYGYIDVYMEYENEPGYWLVEDYLNEEISLLYRFAIIFISIFHSTPKF